MNTKVSIDSSFKLYFNAFIQIRVNDISVIEVRREVFAVPQRICQLSPLRREEWCVNLEGRGWLNLRKRIWSWILGWKIEEPLYEHLLLGKRRNKRCDSFPASYSVQAGPLFKPIIKDTREEIRLNKWIGQNKCGEEVLKNNFQVKIWHGELWSKPLEANRFPRIVIKYLNGP